MIAPVDGSILPRTPAVRLRREPPDTRSGDQPWQSKVRTPSMNRAGPTEKPTPTSSEVTAGPLPNGNALHPVIVVTQRQLQWPAQDTFIALQKWEGKVIEITNDGFVAQVADLTKPENQFEVAEFDKSELSVGDRSLLVPGAIFYWSIGHRDRPGGQRTNESILVFRRLSPLGAEDLAEAQRRVDRLKVDLDW